MDIHSKTATAVVYNGIDSNEFWWRHKFNQMELKRDVYQMANVP